MNADRYIPDRPFRECDSANFWVNNRTTDEKLEDYLRSTRLNQQDTNYIKRLEYSRKLTETLGFRKNGKVLSYNVDCQPNTAVAEWPVHARTVPVKKPRLAALDLPNIRTDICCNVVHWTSSNHMIAALGRITYLWHVPSSTMTKSIKCSYDITALQMNLDSTVLAFAGDELNKCEIKFWYVKKSDILQVTDPVDCNHKNCYVTSIEHHPSNKYLILGCRKGYIAVKTTSDMDSVSKAKNAHNSSEVMRIKCSPDGKYVATSGFDGNVHVWRFPHLELIYSLTESSCSKGISWHPWKSSILCVGCFNGTLSVINVCTGKILSSRRDIGTLNCDVTYNKLSAELVVSQSVYGRVSTSMAFHSQINVLSSLNRVVDRFEGHCRKVLALEWSPDNRILASAGTDETIHLWKFFDDSAQVPSKTRKPTSILNLQQFIR